MKYLSWLISKKVPEYSSRARRSTSLEAMSRWFVGSSRIRKLERETRIFRSERRLFLAARENRYFLGYIGSAEKKRAQKRSCLGLGKKRISSDELFVNRVPRIKHLVLVLRVVTQGYVVAEAALAGETLHAGNHLAESGFPFGRFSR